MSRSESSARPNIANLVKNPIEYISSIVAKKLGINDQDSDGKTALHWAVETSNWTVINYLRQQGADANIADKNHQLAYHSLPKLTADIDHIELRDFIINSMASFGNLQTQEQRDKLLTTFKGLGGNHYEDSNGHTLLDYLFFSHYHDDPFFAPVPHAAWNQVLMRNMTSQVHQYRFQHADKKGFTTFSRLMEMQTEIFPSHYRVDMHLMFILEHQLPKGPMLLHKDLPFEQVPLFSSHGGEAVEKFKQFRADCRQKIQLKRDEIEQQSEEIMLSDTEAAMRSALAFIIGEARIADTHSWNTAPLNDILFELFEPAMQYDDEGEEEPNIFLGLLFLYPEAKFFNATFSDDSILFFDYIRRSSEDNIIEVFGAEDLEGGFVGDYIKRGANIDAYSSKTGSLLHAMLSEEYYKKTSDLILPFIEKIQLSTCLLKNDQGISGLTLLQDKIANGRDDLHQVLGAIRTRATTENNQTVLDAITTIDLNSISSLTGLSITNTAASLPAGDDSIPPSEETTASHNFKVTA